jgi:uncharacterized protein YycO
MVDELQKLAVDITDKRDLEKVLKPGDILFTRPRKIDQIHHKAFYALESRIQGSPYTHVGIYSGNGKVVDAGAWTKRRESSTKVHEVPLNTFTDRYRFKVIRVDATPNQRREAVEYAKDQVGKDFNMKGMLRLALPFKGRPSGERERKENSEAFFCSELVANAYNNVGLVKNKKLEHIMPGDIHRSSKTKTVATFE